MSEGSLFSERETAEWWRQSAHLRARYLSGATERMLDLSGIGPGSRVLDIGVGTGDTTILAAGRVLPGGRVLAIDQSEAMVAEATGAIREAGLDNVELRVIDAGRLALPADYDAVIARHSLQFVPDPAGVLARIRAVLRPLGRLAAIVWDSADANPGMLLAFRATKRRGWLMSPEEPLLAPFSLGDAGRLERLAAGADFRDVAVERLELPRRFDSIAEAVTAYTDSPVARRSLHGLDESQRAAVVAEVTAALRAYEVDAGVAVPSAMLIVSGTA
jgi:SAM-dependent methyltransferase